MSISNSVFRTWLCMWPINSFAILSKFSSGTGSRQINTPKHCIVLNGLTKNVFIGDHDKVSFAFHNDLFMIDPSGFCNYFFVCVSHSAGLLCAKS